MSPPRSAEVIAEMPIVNESFNPIEQLFAALDVIPDDEQIAAPPGAGAPISWQNLVVGTEYWGQMTGFPVQSEPRRFTVREICRFPDGGAMIITEVAGWAWGVGADCESAVGPRNRFWMADRFQT